MSDSQTSHDSTPDSPAVGPSTRPPRRRGQGAPRGRGRGARGRGSGRGLTLNLSPEDEMLMLPIRPFSRFRVFECGRTVSCVKRFPVKTTMAEATSKCYCSVPHCSNNKQRQPYLSFHAFPSFEYDRNKWVHAIRRDQSSTFTILRGSTFVCSRHFTGADYTSATGRKRLRKGAVPSRFIWNNWGETPRESVYNRVRARYGLDACPILSSDDAQDDGDIVPAVAADHDYAVTPYPGAQDAAAARIQELEAEVRRLETKVMQLRIGHSLSQFQRFCASDEDLRFYTRFPSEEVFQAFWKAIEPSASMLVYWSKAQKKGLTTEMEASQSYHRSLPLIDEFFLYCCRVSAGLKEKVLADIFKISLSTVSRTIITWANYLYLILGSLPIWMSRQEVNSTMPEKFRQFCPEVRVIIDCTEIRCQNPSSLTLQSEVFSSYKNTTTFKGLIGVAPCGAVTFVSSLFTGSISDQELTKQSGILDLFEPGDACMADKGFTIKSMLAERGAKLIMPPFKTEAQFSKEDAERTQAIARLRILVERAIRRVKEFHIWDTTVPLTMSGTVNQLWTNCCLMSNFQWPLDVKGHKSVSAS